MYSKTKLLLCFALFLISAQANYAQLKDNPPSVKKENHLKVLHGDTISDNYHWMIENKFDVDFVNYLYAENAYAERNMKDSRLLQKKLYEEYRSYMQEQFDSEPEKEDSFYYYTRYEKDKEFAIYCRKKDSLTAKEEIYLDMNELAKKYMYVDLAGLTLTPDHSIMAYGLNAVGGDAGYFYFKNLNTGQIYPEEIENVSQLVWADNKTFYYIKENSKTKKADRLYRHTLGDSIKNDTLVYFEKEAKISISLEISGDYIILNRGSFSSSESLFLKRTTPFLSFQRFEPIQEGVEYSLTHYKKENYFYILSNWNAPNGQFLRAAIKPTPKEQWEVIVAPNPNIILNNVEVKKDFFIVSEREKGDQHIRIVNRNTHQDYRIKIDQEVYDLGFRAFDYDSTFIRYGYSSLLQPQKLFTHNLLTQKDSVYIDTITKKQELNPEDYTTQRLWATAKDGTFIPMDVVYRKNLELNGKAPVYMTAYASYGMIQPSGFNILLKSIVDRGFIYVLAHPRGESFMGKYWHTEGKLLNKKNTYTDIIACAEYLIDANYTQKGKISIRGGSAGGMLVGSVVTMRPDIWGVAVAEVPFVDVLNQMQDTAWSNIVPHFAEIGNPFMKDQYFAIKQWCPVQNTKAQDYPPILVTSGYNDSRVPVWSPAKWVATLRQVKQDTNLLFLKTNMDAGHGGSAGRYSGFKDEAFTMAFIMNSLGVKENYIEVRGKVVDLDGSPIPFANVFLKNTSYGTICNFDGEFLMELNADQKHLIVIKSVGFSTKEIEVDLDTRTSDLKVILENEDIYIQQVIVTSDGKDPAYGIIKHAQDKRKYYRDLVSSYSADVYMKGSERLNEIPKKMPKFLKKADLPDSTDLGLLYLSESVARFHFQQPEEYKEEMIASKQAGTKRGYSWNRTRDVMFNFYDNLINMRWYSERGFVSPIASSANFYYKYKLEESFRDQGKIIHKINVIPRRKSDPIFKGDIYITDQDWSIHSVNLSIGKESQIEFIDSINIKQSFVPLTDSISMPLSMEITDHIKIFGFGATGKNIGFFNNYKVNREFPEDFFQNEVFKVEKNANQKQADFWEETRPALLTLEEMKTYKKGDSLLTLQSSPAYKDSVNKAHNKVTFGKILIGGYNFRDNFNNYSWGFNSLGTMTDFNTVEGWTLNFQPYFTKRPDSLSFEWFTRYSLKSKLRYSLTNNRLYAEASGMFNLDYFKYQTIKIALGRRATQYNENAIDPFLNTLYTLLYQENYSKLFEETFLDLDYGINLNPSFRINASINYSHRKALINTSDFSYISFAEKEFTSNNPLDPLNDAPAFAPSNALVFNAQLSYYFKRSYQTYPDIRLYNRSEKPVLKINLKKAIPISTGDANYNYADFNISDDIKLNNFGTSYYSATIGGFFGTKNMQFADYKHFNGNQTIFLKSNPAVNVFNSLEYYKYSTNQSYVELNYNHHFNGWGGNKFPLLRKMKIQTLVGANVLYTQDQKDFTEMYFGFENIFGFMRIDFVGQYSSGEKFKPRFRLGIDFGF